MTTPGTTDEPVRVPYGDDPAQFGELYLPTGRRRGGTVVVVHGGFWRSSYDLSLGRPLAAELAAHGYPVWNLEYRRVGNGGGWPATFGDVSAGIDHLAELDVDTSRVVALGHSAGGHLAAWAAGRACLPAGAPGAEPRVRLIGVVSQAGVLDLAGAQRRGIGGGAVADLFGEGQPDADSLALADPMQQLPVPARILCLHDRDDDEVPFEQSESYVAAATAAGGSADLIETYGGHYALIDLTTPAWHSTVATIHDLLPDG